MGYVFALAGNPNCGKTTVFNELTGSTAYVGNWPGVTVEKKEGKARINKEVRVVDLPGIYSLSPYTLEEVIAREYLMKEKPDAIINIVDASNIERNLYLTLQLKELGIPVVVVLNMMDIVQTRQDNINIKQLEEFLQTPIVEATANRGKGVEEALQKAIKVAKSNVKHINYYDDFIESKITALVKELKTEIKGEIFNYHWLAIKLLEGDEKVVDEIQLPDKVKALTESLRLDIQNEYDDEIESIIIDQRYQYISHMTKKAVKKNAREKLTTSDKIDKVLTNRVLAVPIFLGIMWLVYYVAIQTLGDYTIGWVEGLVIEGFGGLVSDWLISAGASDWLQSLVVDGIINGVGSVLVFVPQLMILFFFISILEDSGYMARVAFIMDKFFRRFGLSGKSFIPMLIGSGCSVPGIMATRTLENERDRKLTILLTPFISCGAKLPVYTLFASAFFQGYSGLVVFSLYIIGIVIAIISGIVLRKTVFKGEATPFIMELPEYRIPTIKGLLVHMWDRGKSFIKKAGTIIFAASVLIWFMQSFSFSLQMVEDMSDSILAAIGKAISPIFAPLGFGDWISSVALITGMVAKEVVVSTLGIIHGLGEVGEDSMELIGGIQAMYTPLKAYSFMIFTLLAAPCFAAIGTMKREYNSWKLTLMAIGYQTAVAWVLATLVYQIGSLFI